MRTRSFRGLCLAALLTAFFSQTTLAAGDTIIFANDLDIGIKAVYCAELEKSGKQFIGAVGKESSITIPAKTVPDDPECTRIYVLLENGAGWQFHHEPAPGAAKQITLGWDSPGRNSEERYPSLLIELEDDPYVSPAGLPLTGLKQAIQFGMKESLWNEYAVPGYGSLTNAGQFVISFADISWSLTENGITYEELIPDMQLASRAELTAPFSNTVVIAALDELKAFECLPWLFVLNDTASAFTDQGKKLMPNAASVEGLDPEDAEALWNAVAEMLGKAADSDGGTVRMVFGDEDVRFELELNLETSKAILRVIRNEGAAFG